MKLQLVSVGTRLPGWINEGVDTFVRRMPRDTPMLLTEIRQEPRTQGKPREVLMRAEASRIEAALGHGCRRIVLDEHGQDLTTVALSRRLEAWQQMGCDMAFILGGTDGLDADLKRSAHETLRLSSLTLPHALARLLLAEALYRAWSLLNHHPYHRE